jgi:hypothetical protein
LKNKLHPTPFTSWASYVTHMCFFYCSFLNPSRDGMCTNTCNKWCGNAQKIIISRWHLVQVTGPDTTDAVATAQQVTEKQALSTLHVNSVCHSVQHQFRLLTQSTERGW